MKRVFWFVATSLGMLAGAPPPADAQSFVWFNGLGVSGGGGGMRLRPSNDSGPVSLIPIQPETVTAGSFGAFLSIGTRQWAVMVPEFHYIGYSRDVSQLGVAVRLGPTWMSQFGAGFKRSPTLASASYRSAASRV